MHQRRVQRHSFSLQSMAFLAVAIPVFICCWGLPSAWADQAGPDSSEFLSDLQSFRATCQVVESVDCEASGYLIKTIYERRVRKDPSAKALIADLKPIADEQTEVWGDTILEGDFESDGRERIDRVEGLFKGERLIAYRVVYSEKAWRLEGDGSRGETGRIVEGSFVSPALSTWLRDEASFARFNAK